MAADIAEADVGSAFYRSSDNIKNFKITVTLERVTSASIVPQAAIEQEVTGNVELKDLQQHQNFGGQKDTETYTFRWQEKVYSDREVNFLYKNLQDCQNVLEEKNHQDTEIFRQKSRPTKRLFSYTAYESFSNENEKFKKTTNDPNEKPTLMAEKMATLRHRNTAFNKGRDRIQANSNIVSYSPSPEMVKQNHFVSTRVQTMYIMGDLSHIDRDPLPEDEYVLCTIRMDGNGVLSIQPDFNKSRKPYRVETQGIGREVYEFTLEHASEKLSHLEQEKESKVYKELYARHAEYLQALVGYEFEIPPTEALRVVSYGEIVSARNFEYNNLYVTYFFEMPKHWHCGMGHRLSGVTQICKTKTEGRDNVAYFCFPFSCEFFLNMDSLHGKNSEKMAKLPLMYIEVASIDSWERYRLEGYGYTALPNTPGKHTVHVNCWRPVGRSCLSEMRRFFTGGTPELEDPTYTFIPSTFEGTHLSKYGFRTISTGSVTLNFNVIHQSRAFLQSAASKKKAGSILQHLGVSSAQANVLGVLEAFQKAKERMIAARENLKKDFIDTIKAYETEDD